MVASEPVVASEPEIVEEPVEQVFAAVPENEVTTETTEADEFVPTVNETPVESPFLKASEIDPLSDEPVLEGVITEAAAETFEPTANSIVPDFSDDFFNRETEVETTFEQPAEVVAEVSPYEEAPIQIEEPQESQEVAPNDRLASLLTGANQSMDAEAATLNADQLNPFNSLTAAEAFISEEQLAAGAFYQQASVIEGEIQQAPEVTSWEPPAPSKRKNSRFGGFFRQ